MKKIKWLADYTHTFIHCLKNSVRLRRRRRRRKEREGERERERKQQQKLVAIIHTLVGLRTTNGMLSVLLLTGKILSNLSLIHI